MIQSLGFFLSNQANELKEAGNAAYKKRELTEAIDLYTQAIELDPKNIAFLTNRAGKNLLLS